MFLLSLQWLSLVSVQRVMPVNEMKWKWWMLFFYMKDKTLNVTIVSIGLSWLGIVNSSAENFHYGQRFKNRATNLLRVFVHIKIICPGIFSVRRFFWGIFPQTKIWLLWQLTMAFTRHFCDTLHVLRSEKQTCGHTILKYQGKKTSK